jgi:TIR domain
MTGDTARSNPRLFVTYARGDRDLVDRLAAGLQRLGHEVWLDKRLSVGQEWWAEILNQIRLSEAIVVAFSPGPLESPASTAERGYATSAHSCS